ncbi:MAG TPA: hypothetical protein VFE13_12205 [Caulobacteraceae bacterium]|nr:hypothetical protein [Caulobacteraceae bacterium]
MSKKLIALCAGLALAGSLGFASQASADQAGHGAGNCFLSRDWEGWKSPDPNTIILRVGVRQYYRVDLSAGSNQLDAPAMHLVNKVRGSDWICGPLDLQLELADDHDAFREPLIVKAITRLTPEQVAQIPRKYLP